MYMRSQSKIQLLLIISIAIRYCFNPYQSHIIKNWIIQQSRYFLLQDTLAWVDRWIVLTETNVFTCGGDESRIFFFRKWEIVFTISLKLLCTSNECWEKIIMFGSFPSFNLFISKNKRRAWLSNLQLEAE